MSYSVPNEAKIGLFAFTTIALLYWGINYLNRSKQLQRTTTYHAVYDNTHGLQRKSPVLIHGVSVGSVKAITLDPHHRVVVALDVESHHRLPVGTVAAVTSGGILDKKNIELRYSTATHHLQPGDTLRTAPGGADIFGAIPPIADKTDSLLTRLNAIAAALHTLLSGQGQGSLTAALTNVAQLSSSLHHATEQLSHLMAENRANLGAMVSGLSTTSGNLSALSGHLNDSHAQITSLIGSADATLAHTHALTATLDRYAAQGQLLHLMHHDSLYLNLNRTVNSLDALLVDLRRNPADYVHLSLFGGKKKK